MSTTVDNRIVEMQFENRKFEQGIQTSISSLDKLKKGLQLDGATRGMEAVDKAAKKIDFSGLANAVETVRVKFSALEVFAVTALANIANSAVNTMKRVMSSFTIAPIKTGFQEYETQINAIQTILANTESKGTTLADVTAALDELNTYADKTIYNFTEMTRNIGTFTAAGVDLDKSVTSIKGIANLAAVSGSNAQQASVAMYQLSQALAAGKIQLMDWNSVVNAGMGGELFQNALKRTAKQMGHDVDSLIKKYGSFRESLTQGNWLTAEVLTETLTQLSGAYTEADLIAQGYSEEQAKEIAQLAQTAVDAATKVKTFTQLFDTLKEAAQSGWTQSWEIIVGDFEEARDLLTEISNIFGGMIGESAEYRNSVLQGWKDMGGRTALIDSLRNAFEGVMSIIKPIKEAFSEIFPPTTAKQLYDFTEGLKNLTEKLKISDETSDKLKRTFKGLFAVLDIVKQFFSAAFNAVFSFSGSVGDLGGSVLGVTASIGDWLVKLNEGIKSGEVFEKVFNTIANVIRTLADGIQFATEKVKQFISYIGERFVFPGLEALHPLLESIQYRMSQIGTTASKTKSGVVVAFEAIGTALKNSSFVQFMESIWTLITRLGSALGSFGSKIASVFSSSISGKGFDSLLDLLNSASLTAIGVGLYKFIEGFDKSISKIGKIETKISGIFNSVRKCFEVYQTNLKADALIKIAGAIAILVASIVVVSMIDSDRLSAAIGAITMLFANLIGALAILDKTSGKATGFTKSLVAMNAMATAVLILSGALAVVSSIDPVKMLTGLAGIAALIAMITSTAIILGKNKGSVIKGATQMVIFAAAIKVLASACKDLSELSWDEIGRGLAAVGGLMLEISIFTRTAKFSGKMISTATGTVILAAALKVLASAAKDFADMKWDEIGRSLTAIGAFLLEIAAFTKLTSSAKHVVSTGVALIAISAALKILASVMYDLSGLDFLEIGKGLTGMAGMLLSIAVASRVMPKNMVGIGTGMIAMAASLLILASAMHKMGSMSWEEIASALVALGGSLAIIAAGLKLMTGSASGAASLLLVTGALLLLTPVLSILGAMSWESIAKGLITLAGAFTIIGVAGLLLKPITPAILALSGSIALIGAAVLGIGAGLLLAAAGLSALAVGVTALAAATAAGATSIVASLAIIVMGIVDLIPAIVKKLGEAIVEFCKVITEASPEIGKAVIALVLSTVDVLVECVPELVDGLLKIISETLKAMVEHVPTIVDLVFDFIIEVLNGITKNIPELVEVVLGVITTFFTSIVDALSNLDTDVLIKSIAGVGLISGMLLALSALASLVPSAMIGVLGVAGVIAEIAGVIAAIGLLAQIPGLEWLISEGGTFLEVLGVAIGKFFGGIIGGVASGITGQLPAIAVDLSEFMYAIQPFIQGAAMIQPGMLEGVKALSEVILILTAAEILDGLTSWFTGGSSLSDFAEQLVPFGSAMKEFAAEIEGINTGVINDASVAGKAIAEMAATLPNSGGVVGFFAGENDMRQFVDQLGPFGKAMNEFATEVKGIDTGVVANAATAGKAIAEMAATLPNSGGVVGFFVGENDMREFAKQIVPFGKALKEFGDSVSGLNQEIVVNSANAGKALAEMAGTVPNTGGLVAWFTGENDLKTFGENIVPFGTALAEYSIAVKDLDANVVGNSANAAKALVELSNNLPNTGGIVSWFTGDNDIATFGGQLVAFGGSLNAYYNSVKTVDTEKLNAIAKEFQTLVSLANGITDLDVDTMSGFAGDLTELGNTGIDGFISAFDGATDRITGAVQGMLDVAIAAFPVKDSEFESCGTTAMEKFSNGITGAASSVELKVATVILAVSNKFRVNMHLFTTFGTDSINAIIDGMESQETFLMASARKLVLRASSEIKECRDSFKNSATYLIDGFIDELRRRESEVRNVGSALGHAAEEGLNKALEINSPSKVAERAADFFSSGFVNKIKGSYGMVKSTTASMGDAARVGLNSAISTINRLLSDEIDTSPKIRPVLDLSSMRGGLRGLNTMLTTQHAVAVATSEYERSHADVRNDNAGIVSGSTFSFVQNNYSPKPLSRIDIYRNTKNQISVAKGLITK